MQFLVKSGSAVRLRTGCAIVGVFESGQLTEAARDLDKTSSGRVRRAVSAGDIRGKLGESLLLDRLPRTNPERVLLVGLGPRSSFSIKQYRRALGEAANVLGKIGTRDAISFLALEKVKGAGVANRARHAVEAMAHGLYRFNVLKTEPETPAMRRFGIAVEQGDRQDARRGLRNGEAIADGVRLARDLGNLPSNVCTPSYLARVARDLAREHSKLTAKVSSAAEMKKLGMNALLAVTQGSREPAKLIVLQYRGGTSKQAPIALLGKGITFDSGGICVKPAPQMDEMKYDMCGAASVLGTFKAIAQLELPLNLVGVIPACENMPDGRATRPGDIVKTMSGKTVEILNTDAEGRLLLCDALTYVRRFRPVAVVDIATLTGACVIALGAHFSGLMSNDEALARELAAAGGAAEDPAWPLPLSEEYGEQLKSNFADFANVGGRPGGAITAACFLSRFAEDLRWAHLDIAGTAWLGGQNKGGTGRPVPLLVQFLSNRLESAGES